MKLLVTANFSDEGLAELSAMGFEVIYEPWTRRNKLLLADELAERVKETGAEALIIEVDLCHEEVFEAATLRFVGCCRCDPLIVDLDAAGELGVPVFYTPGRNCEAVADLTIGLLLDLLRGITRVSSALRSGAFCPETPADYMAFLQQAAGREVGALTVGLVGLGAVGSAVARRLAGFGCRIIAADPFAPDERFAAHGVERVALEEVFRRADVVSIHAAELEENEGMITAELIGSMKPGAYFLNLARASLVDNDALYAALKDGRLAGAGLDVFDREPVSCDDRFVGLPNVIALPHLGGTTREVIRHQTDLIMASLRALREGRAPACCANPQALKPGRQLF